MDSKIIGQLGMEGGGHVTSVLEENGHAVMAGENPGVAGDRGEEGRPDKDRGKGTVAQFVVVDGVEAKSYGGFVRGVELVFHRPNAFHFWGTARTGDHYSLVRVEVEIVVE